MSEETRRIRAEAQAVADIEIGTIQDTIAKLEETIAEIQRGVPSELPEDHEWRLAQLDPVSRHLVKFAEEMFRKAAIQEVEQRNSFLDAMKYAEGTEWKVNTKLQVKYPSNFSIGPLKEEPK